jgi:DNA-binding PucR family transcriptional regulator
LNAHASEQVAGQALDALRAAARGLELDAETVGARICDALYTEVPELPGDSRSRAGTLRASIETTLHVVRVVSGSAVDARTPPARPMLSARALARSGQDAQVLVRVGHVTHRILIGELEQRLLNLNLPVEVLAEAIERCQKTTFEWTGAALEQLVAEYQEEFDRLAQTGQAKRARTVRALLAGDPLDKDAASRDLAYDLDSHHTALIIWTSGGEGGLEYAAAEAAAALGGRRPLVLPVTRTTLWVWVPSVRPPAVTVEALGARDDEVSIAVGEPARGISGFRTSHEDAQVAHRVAEIGDRRPGTVTSYAHVQLAAIFSADLPRTRRFVRTYLGDLATNDDQHRRLRATLKVFLDEHRSRQATAERIGVHVNTIRNRMRTIEETLGDRLRQEPAELHVALAIAERLGDSVLI